MAQAVTAAILSFTEIAPGGHAGFNRWHRYVHQPELFLIDGIVAAARLVATPDLLARRYCSNDALAGTQYFGYYLLAEPVEAVFTAMAEFGPREIARGRGYERRGPSSTSRLAHMHTAPGALSAPAVMPFRPHRGVYVTVDDPQPTATPREMDVGLAWGEAETVPHMLNLPGVAGCWTFEYQVSSANFATSQMADSIPDRRVTRIYWLEGEPSQFLDVLKADPPFERAAPDRVYDSVLRCAYHEITVNSQFDWFDKP